MTEPQPGDFVAWIVGIPGPDIDYALCIDRKDDRALLRFQIWQQPGPWHEDWRHIYGSTGIQVCWKTNNLHEIGQALRDERARLFGEATIFGGA